MTYPRREDPPTLREEASPGCYVYCVAPLGQDGLLDLQGIEGARLSVVAHRGLCAFVQGWQEASPPEDEGHLAAWALAHHRVVEAVWRQRGSALPLAFPTVFRAAIGEDGEEPVRRWLEAEEATLMGKLENLAGKAEYSVQVLWDPALVTHHPLMEERGQQRSSPGQSPGRAYMERLLLEAAERRSQEARLREQLQELQARIGRWAERLLVERPRQAAGGPPMFLNLACLLTPDQLPHLAAGLEQAKRGMTGLTIRLVGPLPPYSFC